MRGRGIEEVVLPFRAPPETLGVATQVRTTLLVSSLHSLRRRGSYDDYLQHLPLPHHATITSMIAGQWAPMAVGLAHYEACQALGIAEPQVRAIGREVGDRIQGTFLATMLRMVGTVGATPWTGIGFVGRLYERLFAGGGGVSVVKQGPKDARVLFVGLPVASIPYYRTAMNGVFEVGLDLFCKKSYVAEVRGAGTATSTVLHVAWA